MIENWRMVNASRIESKTSNRYSIKLALSMAVWFDISMSGDSILIARARNEKKRRNNYFVRDFFPIPPSYSVSNSTEIGLL